MIGPPSQISKLLLFLLIMLLYYFAYMDISLYIRIHNYPLSNSANSSVLYKDVTWVSCEINPLCKVTVKALLVDHTNYYLFGPLVKIFDKIVGISNVTWITPNSVSVFHIFVAFASAKFVSSNNLAHRRIGIVLFELRTWLDDLDGYLARSRKHIEGEHSDFGSAGYYIDGLCDAIGSTALILGIFVFLKNNPPRRGYIQLPTVSDTKEGTATYNQNVTLKKVVKVVLMLSVLLILSSAAWNRYIAVYQDLLETESGPLHSARQEIVFRSIFFYTVAWLWRVVNVHNLTHFLLLSIFCDKLWEFLRGIRYLGFCILLSIVVITELNLIDVKRCLLHLKTVS